MPGASISRWTMAYFASAVAIFAAALALLGAGFGLPSSAIDAPDTLVVVHLVTIGWLGLLFCGALLQFVPVLTATNLRLDLFALPALFAIVIGLALLIAGFLALGGRLGVDPMITIAAAALLIAGFGLLIVSLGATILSQKFSGVSGLLVLLGLVALVVTLATGATFAGLLSGSLGLPDLAARLPTLMPYHAASGLLGWMTLTAVGVSYRLFVMFMLSPEATRTAKPVGMLAILALVALYAALAIGLFDEGRSGMMALAALALSAMLAALYGHDVWRMVRARRRKALELNSTAALIALLFLAIGLGLLAVEQLVDTDLPLGVGAFYLLGLGWLSGLGLAQLYKIVPFLTWLEVYGAVMGRMQVPRVQDLVNERTARAWFAVYYLAVAAGGASILLGLDMPLRIASWCQATAVVALAFEFVRARRLAYAPDQLRSPAGTIRPRLFCATISSKERTNAH